MNVSTINSLVGMYSLQQKLDTIANNIANVNTIGYKSRDAVFDEILSSRIQQPDAFQLEGRTSPAGLDQGYGAKVSMTPADFTQGTRMDTGISTDVMLNGDNIFFTVSPPADGYMDPMNVRYTRNGHFQIDGKGNLVTDQGDLVLNSDGDTIYVPEGASITIDQKGNIMAQYSNGETEDIGALKITKINSPQALEDVGANQYKVPQDLIDKNISIVDEGFDMNENNQYSVVQGSLENSNTDIAKELVDLNETQRAYQFLSRGITISDQMMAIANNLKG